MKSVKTRKFNNSGMTLVELIASLTLISLFMVAASNMIFKTMSIYYQARGTSYGLQVAELVAGKASSLIEGAQDVASLEDTDDYTNVTMTAVNTAVLITEGSGENRLDSVDLVDSTGSRIRITTEEENGKNYLSIHYYPVPDGDKKYNEARDRYYYERLLYKAVDWKLDSKAYMDYSIKSLVFEKPEGFPGNVLRMKLTVVSEKYGEYSTTKYIECYDFDETDYNKIRFDF